MMARNEFALFLTHGTDPNFMHLEILVGLKIELVGVLTCIEPIGNTPTRLDTVKALIGMLEPCSLPFYHYSYFFVQVLFIVYAHDIISSL
jgi:hypothetical protein